MWTMRANSCVWCFRANTKLTEHPSAGTVIESLGSDCRAGVVWFGKAEPD